MQLFYRLFNFIVSCVSTILVLLTNLQTFLFDHPNTKNFFSQYLFFTVLVYNCLMDLANV